jgi:hypothetical protein
MYLKSEGLANSHKKLFSMCSVSSFSDKISVKVERTKRSMLAKGKMPFFEKLAPTAIIPSWLILPEIAEGLPLLFLIVSLFLITQAALPWFK